MIEDKRTTPNDPLVVADSKAANKPAAPVVPAERPAFTTKVEDAVIVVPAKPPVNPMAQPQPIKALSEAQHDTQVDLAKAAPVGVTADGKPISDTTTQQGRPITTGAAVKLPSNAQPLEQRVEVPPGMEHLADEKEQIAYATITVSDKTVPRSVVAEPLGSRRLAAEQEAGRQSLIRKHGPDQITRERAQGAHAAARAKANTDAV